MQKHHYLRTACPYNLRKTNLRGKLLRWLPQNFHYTLTTMYLLQYSSLDISQTQIYSPKFRSFRFQFKQFTNRRFWYICTELFWNRIK